MITLRTCPDQVVYAYLVEVVIAEEAGLSTDHIQRPASYPRDMRVNVAMRCAVVMRVPQFDKALQEVEWGFFCKGCFDKKLYTNKTFEKHLENYGNIEDGVHQSPSRVRGE
jgi:hypothetical protein